MKEIFERAIDRLKKSLSAGEFNIWLKDLKFGRFDEDKTLFLATSSQFKSEKIRRSYLDSVSQCLREEGGNFSKISLEISPPEAPLSDPPSHKQTPSSPMAGNVKTAEKPPRSESLVKVNPTLAFENFVECGFNKIAYEFSKKVTEKLGAVSPLYIYGGVGLGKTHLLHAIGNHYLKNFSFLKVACVNPNDFVAEFTKSLSEKRDRQFRLKYRSLDVLLLDDIQFFVGKQKSCVEFFHIFNEVYKPGDKQMVFCSDRVPQEIGDLDDRLKSRLSSSAIVEIEAPKDEERKEILRYYCEESSLVLKEAIIDFISERIPPDIRKIIGVVNTLVAYKDIQEGEITVDFCKHHLKQLIFNKEERDLTPETLLLAVSNHAKIPLADFRSPKRTKTLAYFRQILMYLLRKHTTFSLPEIGRFLGGKTNSALLFGMRKIEKKIEEDLVLRQTVQAILTRTQEF